MDRVMQYNRVANEGAKLPAELPNSGYYSYRVKEEGPIFTKKKVNLNLPEEVTHLTVSNNWLICLMSHQVLLRIFLPKPDELSEVFLDEFVTRHNVTNLFLDPSSNHLLISMSSKIAGVQPELLYLHKKMDKPKKVYMFKDQEVTAVAFNHNDVTEESTGPILVGTSKGLILENMFGLEGWGFFSNSWKQIYDEISKNPAPEITGLDFFKVPNTRRYIVFASTRDCLYKFQENLKSDDKLVLQSIFKQYLNLPEKFLIFRSTDSDNKTSLMAFNCNSSDKYPKQMAWLRDESILYYQIDELALSPEFTKDEDIIDIPKQRSSAQTLANNSYSSTREIKYLPKAFELTDFHVLIMYPDHVTAVCTLNQEVVYEEYIPEKFGIFLNVIKDFQTGSIYMYASKAIFLLRITSEHRNVWKIYLEKNDYVLAEKYARDNREHLDIVLRQKAEQTFLEHKFIESASIFAETRLSFEKVSLKFLELQDKKPLIIYLTSRLNKLNDEDKQQITLLTMWLIELHIDRITKSKNNEDEQAAFKNFMSNPRVQECCRKEYTVIYNLIASHGDKYNLTNLVIAEKKYEAVVNQYVIEGELSKALETIEQQRIPDLFYKYCPILVENYPQKTISAIIEQKHLLDPEKLIPTLISINQEEHSSQIISYLEYAVYKLQNTNKSIHNYFVKLLAKENQQKLMDYLEQHRDLNEILYDIDYALRVCEEHEAKKASVFLQCLLELWESAVESALQFDVDLAKKTAMQPSNKDMQRKLWLKIAQHEVKRNVDVRGALKLLRESDLLKIEDILPHFDDFTKIDSFKTGICNALKEYNMKIQELQHDMDEASKASERVSQELQGIRNRSLIISPQDQCAICENLILIRPFFIFPCGHKFHSDCLEKQIVPYLNKEESRKLNQLKSQLDNLSTAVIVTSQSQSNESQQKKQLHQNNSREKIKMKIENILAADCLFCGYMIDTIDKPFIEDDDWVRVNIDWQ